VIGDPVVHSLSPLLHNAAFDAMGLDWVSVGFEVRSGQVPAVFEGMRALGIAGLSVTTPHKDAAAAVVDECSDLAARLAAVNCVTLRDGRLFGDSTDGLGFLASLRRGSGFDPAGKRCLVLGAGGAARAVVCALAGAGAADVVVVNRTPQRAVLAASLAGDVGRVGTEEDVPGSDLVVQATPIGMGSRDGTTRGEAPEIVVDAGLFHGGQLVTDLVYHPSVTPFLREAASRGARTLGGLGMLVHQAALAIEHWTELEAPVEAMWAAVQSD